MTTATADRTVDDPLDVAVVGGGMAGLLATLFLARDGHRVTVVERDDTDLPATADEAFSDWNRQGASHARQSHALLARLRSILRRRAPDVLEALEDEGATELSIERTLPAAIEDRAPPDGDDELAIMCCRRLTLEWVLRRAVDAEPGVSWRRGVEVTGFVADGTDVSGVRLADGGSVDADLVVVAGGRQSPAMTWVTDLGGDVAPTEEVEEAGIIYLSRFYRLREGRELPVLTEHGAGGDLGYLAFAGFYGDNRTFSITFGVPVGDRELMALRDPDAWEAVVRTLLPLRPWTEDGLAEPITDVEVMARLQNRIRRFVVDGTPAMTGAVVIGDAAMSTNPWYGKGCSMAGIWASSLSEALATHGRDRHAVAIALDEALTAELEPHYALSCRQDADRIRLHRARRDGTEPDPAAGAARDFVLHGLLPAARSDADVFRTFFRSFNMLDHPDALMQDPTVVEAAMAALAAKDERPPPPVLGPEREDLLELMAAASG